MQVQLDKILENKQKGLNCKLKQEVEEEIIFYRGVGYYDAAETVEMQNFNIERIKENQHRNNVSNKNFLYLTTQKETAHFFGSAKNPPHPGGYAILEIKINKNDWQGFTSKYGDTIFERPIDRMPQHTETLIALENVKNFVDIIKKYTKIKICETQY